MNENNDQQQRGKQQIALKDGCIYRSREGRRFHVSLSTHGLGPFFGRQEGGEGGFYFNADGTFVRGDYKRYDGFDLIEKVAA